MDQQRTIRVTGKGTLHLRPDLTRLTMTLQGTETDYADALRKSAEDTETLRGVLEGLGFARDRLKTAQFGVESVYEGCQDEKGVYRNRFAGYQFQHTLSLEFAIDDALLGRTLYALARSGVAAEFHIAYALADPEAAKNALLAQAVRDAAAKADVLAGAAGLTLGAIVNIDYSFADAEFAVRPMRKLAMAANGVDAAGGSYDMGIEPEDIRVSDTVTVLWEIRNGGEN